MKNTLSPHSKQTIPMAFSMISAGPAAEIGEDFQGLDVNSLITGEREGFAAFEVTGDSAAPHIQPGYIVFVDTWAQAKNGDLVASTVNGLTCVKRFQHSSKGLRLVSNNEAYPPREIHASD